MTSYFMPCRLVPTACYSSSPCPGSRCRCSLSRGFTLIELIVAISILVILTGMAIPLARVRVQAYKEHQLRQDLTDLRDGLDRYRTVMESGAIAVRTTATSVPNKSVYPQKLSDLVTGIEISQGKKMKFLRRLPIDPMTGNDEWGVRSSSDDPDTESTDEYDVFDVYTKSEGTALDGSKYKDW